MTARRLFATIFVMLYVVVGAQSFATPRNAGPDEPAHLVRAGGLVRGDVFGSSSGGQDAVRNFDVPGWVGQPDPGCYSPRPDVPASCAVVRVQPGLVASTAGSYQIWPHLLPGAGTLVPGEASTVWISRLLGALVPVGLVAAALSELLARGRRHEATAVLLALTPMAVFSMAVVNPSGIAVGGAIAMWVGGLQLDAARRSPGLLFAAGWAALMLSRSDGIIWCGVISVLLLLHRQVAVCHAAAMLSRAARAVVVVSTVLAAGWTVAVRPELIDEPETATGRALVTKIIGETGMHLREAIGVVGWLDTDIPTTMVFLWIAAFGALLGLGVLNGTRREFGVLALGVGLLVAVPWVLEFVQASRAGLFWQGRYGLPLFVGLVILAGSVAARQPSSTRILWFVGASSWVVWNVSLLQQMRRWAVGASGTMAPWNWDVGVGTITTVVVALVHLVASAALVALVVTGLPSTGGRVRRTAGEGLP